jgi:transposase
VLKGYLCHSDDSGARVWPKVGHRGQRGAWHRALRTALRRPARGCRLQRFMRPISHDRNHRPNQRRRPRKRRSSRGTRETGGTHRAQALRSEIRELDRQICALLAARAPSTLGIFAMGPDTAALLVVIGDNPDRIRSEAVFARLCGVAPIPASSAKIVRHRLHRGGDRSANQAVSPRVAPNRDHRC